jgi:hypothetical protein
MKEVYNREGIIMKNFHTCDYRNNSSWLEPDENVKDCIKKNKTVSKIRRELVKKRLEKHKKKLASRKSK